MGLFCCCFRPKVFESERKRILEDKNEGMNRLKNLSEDLTPLLLKTAPKGDPSEIEPSINSLLYRLPTIGLSQQSLFDITVQQMASKMVNIPALDNEFPQVFWRDRQKAYAKRVYNIKNPLPLRSDFEKTRPKSETSDHKHLSVNERCLKMEKISREDLKLVNELSEKSSNAVKQGYKLFWSDKPFVVEFNPNKNL